MKRGGRHEHITMQIQIHMCIHQKLISKQSREQIQKKVTTEREV